MQRVTNNLVCSTSLWLILSITKVTEVPPPAILVPAIKAIKGIEAKTETHTGSANSRTTTETCVLEAMQPLRALRYLIVPKAELSAFDS